MATPARQPQPATSAERTALYKTFTNPIRRRILDYIGYYGEANSTSVAKALGESTGTTSYHLRKLAEQRLIEEIPERSAGRERWWRQLRFEHTAAAPDQRTPEEDAALREWASQRLGGDIELFIKAMTEYDGPEGWAQVQRTGGAYLTREELVAFFGEYLALLRKYSRPKEGAPADAQPVAFRFFAVPEPDQPVPEYSFVNGELSTRYACRIHP
ncbi:MAG: ArsR/SmtB family transcription factor [Trebonia sp.]